MRIKEAIIYPLSCDLKEYSFSYSQGVHSKRTSVIVELISESGERGIGESGPGSPEPIAYKMREMLEVIVGKEISYNEMYNVLYSRLVILDEGTTAFNALSALDIALNDLLSKSFNIPIADIYGGALRQSIPIYAATGYFSLDRSTDLKFLSKQVEEALEIKPNGIKIKIGGNIEKDIERIKVARDIINGQSLLMVDANQSYTTVDAIRLAKKIKDDVFWFEEPINYKDLNGMRKISEEGGIIVAAGESLTSIQDFKEYILRGSVNILQPDITRVGGIKGLFKTFSITEIFNVLMFPHNWSTQISTIASALVLSTLPSNVHSYPYGAAEYLLEYDLAPNPLRETLHENFSVSKGRIFLKNKVGLGVEFDKNKASKYLLRDPIIIK